MGALFRNAAAFGVDAIILDSACCDPLYRKAIRVSMGHALSIRWAVAEDWVELLKQIKIQLGVKLEMMLRQYGMSIQPQKLDSLWVRRRQVYQRERLHCVTKLLKFR